MRVALQRLLQDPPPLRVCFLIDNDQIQTKLAHSIRLSRSNKLPPQDSGIRIPVFLSLLNALSLSTQLHCAWIIGHASFQGHKVSDYFSKWAVHVLLWHTNMTLPPLCSLSR